jgi:asparagine synthase (glutamine-hydrolysing)
MIQCYYTSIYDIIIVFSDLRSLRMRPETAHRDAWLVPLEVNWRYIAGFLAESQMQIRETGFKDVHELLAGESLNITLGRRSVRALWDPVSIAASDPLPTVEAACRELRDTTFHCIDAWAGVHRNIVLSLSGGFDSSLVLSLLMRTANTPRVVSVTRFASGPAEDERRYARLAALAAGVELMELPWDHEYRFEKLCSGTPVTVKPTITQVFAGMDAAVNSMFAARNEVEAIWTGQGGDHLFMAVKTGIAVVDCFRHHGFGSLLKAAFRDAATVTGKSYLHLARDARALRRSRNFFSVAKLTPNTPFLAADRLLGRTDAYTHHPWTLASATLPPAKRLQVIYLAELLNRHRPYYGIQKLQEFHPLLSQPLIELCLRIPVYRLLIDGKTRGLARRAFQSDLPPAIRDRQRKGQTTHHTLGLVRSNLPFIRTRLLNGHLADRRLLNGDALSAALQPHASISGPTLFSLLGCLAAEVWLEDWLGSERPRDIPADFQPSAPCGATNH